MPTEYRKLVFSNGELRQAVAEFSEANGLILPQDEIIKLDLTGQRQHPVTYHYTTGTQRGSTEVSLSRDQLAAALIIYCRSLRIPVPRSAQKNVKIDGTEVSLLLHVPS